MRQIKFFVNEREVGSFQSGNNTPVVSVEIDGVHRCVVEVPERITKEPEPLGAKVSGFVQGSKYLYELTKIAPNRWIYPSGKAAGSTRQLWTEVHWSLIACSEVISPKPEKPPLEEPTGIAAVIHGDCPYCKIPDIAFVRQECIADDDVSWFCQNCGTGFDWKDLDKEAITIASKGMEDDDGRR